MADISDAYESAYTIMLNLNKTWIQKQGDFFVESPIILLAAIIWYLRIYKDGKYCTFPHAIEFLNKPYADIFTILTSYPSLENYLSPFMDAWLLFFRVHRRGTAFVFAAGAAFCRAVSVLPDRGLHPHP